MEKRIKNFKELVNHIGDCRKNFFENIKNNGGINLCCRVFVAQLLWLTLIYNIGMLLIPVKQFLLSVTNIILLVVIYRIIENKIPNSIDNFLKGDFFRKFDIVFLNYWIFSLVLLIAGYLIFAKDYLNNIKLYGNKE